MNIIKYMNTPNVRWFSKPISSHCQQLNHYLADIFMTCYARRRDVYNMFNIYIYRCYIIYHYSSEFEEKQRTGNHVLK